MVSKIVIITWDENDCTQRLCDLDSRSLVGAVNQIPIHMKYTQKYIIHIQAQIQQLKIHQLLTKYSL